jgi:nucleotide-binding universal stress UspA family protein
MSSLSKMLLVYDETHEAQAALARCAQLSMALSAHVDVVSVVDLVSANAVCAGMLSELGYARLEQFARDRLQAAVGHLTDNGVAARGYLTFSRMVDVILSHATAFSSDFVVIGHRRQTGPSRWWSERPAHVHLAERLHGSTLITVTPPAS